MIQKDGLNKPADQNTHDVTTQMKHISDPSQRLLRLRESATNIQGDSGGICITLGNDSMSDSKQKSSYEHGSDFKRLRSYDRLKLGIEGNDY